MTIETAIAEVIECLRVWDKKARQAKMFIDNKTVVRATRRVTDKFEVVLSVGRPNYAEREFIKVHKEAKLSTPKGTLVTYPPKKRK
jgi:hypothetical protein